MYTIGDIRVFFHNGVDIIQSLRVNQSRGIQFKNKITKNNLQKYYVIKMQVHKLIR